MKNLFALAGLAAFVSANPSARNIRVYSHLDIRLMLDDFTAKRALLNEKK